MATRHMAHKRAPVQEAVAQLKAEPATEAVSLIPSPLLIAPNSGLYTYSPFLLIPGSAPSYAATTAPGGGSTGITDLEGKEAGVPPAIPILSFTISEELRLDVDGSYPQMKASGQISGFKVNPGFWIANLSKTGANTYEGAIWYKDGNLGLIAATSVKIEVHRTVLFPQSATVTFFEGKTINRVRTFKYSSRYFHPINFEFDSAEGVSPILSYNTGSHPNRPASLPVENLSIATVYRRAGFDVSISGEGDTVPIAAAGADAKWSDAEMHDAMQVHWSKFANAPQWALWTFFASLHEMGPSLGGIMFDDVGPNQRQGTSLFLDSFIKTAPAGDPAASAWANRMAFWTACHEMGHTFNLAHSWQKELPIPWIPLVNEPEARSFMNYPFKVTGGTSAFFANFEYRFSDAELLFLRHAPFRFVEQGNAAWFDHHGFQQAGASLEPKFSLSLECPSSTGSFEFLEPVVVHLKLRNISDQPQLIGDKLLASTDLMTIVIKKRGRPARELLPYAQRCFKEDSVVLKPGAEWKDSVFLVGRNGWDLAEPGYYTVQASLNVSGEEIVSEPITVRVAPPKGYEEEYLAQDFFSDDVGRVLSFDGSRYLGSANDTLRQVVERLPGSRAAIHSRVALAAPLAYDYKCVHVEECTHTLTVGKADLLEAGKLVSVLTQDSSTAASTLGRVDYDYYRGRFKSLLGEMRIAA